jgi:plastocyanin
MSRTHYIASAICTITAFWGAASLNAATEDIMIMHFQFDPDEITVEAGTTVRWTNHDSIEHTVTSQKAKDTLIHDGRFDSGLMNRGDVFEFHFVDPGEYWYWCVPHGSSMQGVVYVVPRRPCLGDMNCDGGIDFDDIDPFVLALVSPEDYAVAYPDCNVLNGDTDQDGDVDFDDIDELIELLGSDCS